MRREPTFDAFGPDDDELVERPRPFLQARFGAKVVVAAALITGLTLAAKGTMQHKPVAEPWTDPPGAASAQLARAAVPTPLGGPLLRLDPVEGEQAGRAEPPRWNPASGLREDALGAGSFDAIEAPFLRITLTEIGPDTDPPPSLFVALARRAAEMQGLSVLRTGLRGQLETKFGAVETVDTTLSGQGIRTCTGFRSIAQSRMRIDGWLCGLLGQAPDEKAVACALDRLALASRAGETLETAFADADARRLAGCGPVSTSRAESTGSLAKPKADVRGRPKKNEAQMRQIVQARQ